MHDRDAVRAGGTLGIDVDPLPTLGWLGGGVDAGLGASIQRLTPRAVPATVRSDPMPKTAVHS
ncbi:hypothetical protein [Nocardia sp. NPDC050412]|uniref:hypothetical protein n=1 Tax=Nocardia sp. NPDC050412 TaxID=3364320 RepID=UPI0037B4177E